MGLSRLKAKRRNSDGVTRGVKRRRRAFTLVELLIVIAIIAILAAILMPVLDKAQQRAINIGAVNNIRQEGTGCSMYTTDNGGYLPQGRSAEGGPAWCAGQMRGPQGGTAPSIGGTYAGVEDYTNRALIMDPKYSQLGSIIQDPRVMLDPGDKSTWKNPGGGRFGRVRSFSMNCAISPDTKDDGYPLGPQGTWRYYYKESDMKAPSPSDLWLYLDEHPDSINDDYFSFVMPINANLTSWVDMPAAYHNGACAFAFADGHAELHPWRLPGVFPLVNWNVEQTVTPIRAQTSNLGNNPDILWFAAHTTAPAQTAPPNTFYP